MLIHWKGELSSYGSARELFWQHRTVLRLPMIEPAAEIGVLKQSYVQHFAGAHAFKHTSQVSR
jgi:hypothetical protein